MMKPRWSALLVVAAFVALSTNASASPTFPSVVKETLSLGSPPDCTLCHASPSGGMGTANTGFATYLKSRGLRGGDQASLRSALQAMIGEKHDTDGDGVPDADELKNGTDPNGAVDAAVPPVAYGCGGAQVSPRRALPWPLAMVLFACALAAVLLRRRA